MTTITTTARVVNDLLFDHPGWRVSTEGKAYRAVRSGDGIYVVVCSPPENDRRTIRVYPRRGEGWQPILDPVDPQLIIGTYDPIAPLRTAGPVDRLRNPSLWDALGWAILRKAPLTCGQLHYSYRILGSLLGNAILTPAGTAYLFPHPERVVDATDNEFGSLKIDIRRTLRTAARSYLTSAALWHNLDPSALLVAVQRITGIGPQTASLAVADFTNVTNFIPLIAPGRSVHDRTDRVAGP